MIRFYNHIDKNRFSQSNIVDDWLILADHTARFDATKLSSFVLSDGVNWT